MFPHFPLYTSGINSGAKDLGQARAAFGIERKSSLRRPGSSSREVTGGSRPGEAAKKGATEEKDKEGEEPQKRHLKTSSFERDLNEKNYSYEVGRLATGHDRGGTEELGT